MRSWIAHLIFLAVTLAVVIKMGMHFADFLNLGKPRGPMGGSTVEPGFAVPVGYPPTTLATEVWNWGQATGDYTSAVQADTYVAGSGGTPGHLYGQTGPSGTQMSAVYWRNDGSFSSHHTAPGTTSGQSNGAVNANMKPVASSFKFYFFMKHVNGPDVFYYFFDYDLQQDAVTFNPGMQFFVSTAGIFAPCSIAALVRDDAGNNGQWHAKTGGTTLFEDNQWHFVEMIFDRSKAAPTFRVDGVDLAVVNTFGGPALSALGVINPTNGIRFGMREFSEITTGRGDLQMAAAAYSKDLNYVWQ